MALQMGTIMPDDDTGSTEEQRRAAALQVARKLVSDAREPNGRSAGKPDGAE